MYVYLCHCTMSSMFLCWHPLVIYVHLLWKIFRDSSAMTVCFLFKAVNHLISLLSLRYIQSPFYPRLFWTLALKCCYILSECFVHTRVQHATEYIYIFCCFSIAHKPFSAFAFNVLFNAL